MRRNRLQELLRIQPRCAPSARAWVFASIGECFLRARDWEQAELHLHTALALAPDAKPTLKSLVRTRVLCMHNSSHSTCIAMHSNSTRLTGSYVLLLQAKLYTKTKDVALRDEMVERLRQLDAS